MNINSRAVRYIFLMLLIGTSFGCVKNVDFDQTEDFRLEPVYELAFVYSRITAPKFREPLTDDFQPVLRDVLEDEFFNGDFVDNLLEAELLFSLENSIPTGFEAELRFLDAANREIPISISPIVVRVQAGSEEDPVLEERTFLFSREDLEALRLSTKIESTVFIEGRNTTLGGTLILQSKAIFYTTFTE